MRAYLFLIFIFGMPARRQAAKRYLLYQHEKPNSISNPFYFGAQIYGFFTFFKIIFKKTQNKLVKKGEIYLFLLFAPF